MAIGARAQKAGVIGRVLLPGGAGSMQRSRFRCRWRGTSRSRARRYSDRNLRKDCYRGRADLGEHLPAFFVGFKASNA